MDLVYKLVVAASCETEDATGEMDRWCCQIYPVPVQNPNPCQYPSWTGNTNTSALQKYRMNTRATPKHTWGIAATYLGMPGEYERNT